MRVLEYGKEGAGISQRILQRRSWKILGWASVMAIWAVGISAAVSGIYKHGNYRDAIFFTAVIAAISSFCRRYGTSRVILTHESIVVVGVFGLCSIPNESVREVVGDPRGGLLISTVHGDEIRPFCFGGSLIDIRFGTSQRAASQIRAMLSSPPKSPSNTPRMEKQILRHSFGADLFLAMAILAGLVGLVLIVLGVI